MFKQIFTFYNRRFLYCWFLLIFSLMAMLAYEYTYFKNRAEELCGLKDDYATYIVALKKLIVEYSSLKEQQIQQNIKLSDESDKKKK